MTDGGGYDNSSVGHSGGRVEGKEQEREQQKRRKGRRRSTGSDEARRGSARSAKRLRHGEERRNGRARERERERERERTFAPSR